MKYDVIFVKKIVQSVEADTRDKAIEKAIEEMNPDATAITRDDLDYVYENPR